MHMPLTTRVKVQKSGRSGSSTSAMPKIAAEKRTSAEVQVGPLPDSRIQKSRSPSGDDTLSSFLRPPDATRQPRPIDSIGNVSDLFVRYWQQCSQLSESTTHFVVRKTKPHDPRLLQIPDPWMSRVCARQRISQPCTCGRLQERGAGPEVSFIFCVCRFGFVEQDTFWLEIRHPLASGGDHLRTRAADGFVAAKSPRQAVTRFEEDIHAPTLNGLVQDPYLMSPWFRD